MNEWLVATCICLIYLVAVVCVCIVSVSLSQSVTCPCDRKKPKDPSKVYLLNTLGRASWMGMIMVFVYPQGKFTLCELEWPPFEVGWFPDESLVPQAVRAVWML